jgi:hypothetical protein
LTCSGSSDRRSSALRCKSLCEPVADATRRSRYNRYTPLEVLHDLSTLSSDRVYPPGVNLPSVVIELMQFSLMPGTGLEEFLAADQRLQTEFAYAQPGLLRRTTARNETGEWLVIDLWRTAADADACAERWEQDRIAQGFMALVDRTSVRVERYSTI